MPPAGAVLFNHATGQYEQVPAADVGAAIESGNYTASGALPSRAAGGPVARPVGQVGAADVQGETIAVDTLAELGATERLEQRKDALSDPAFTFAEGVVDALSIGLIHGRGEMADLRREADSGSALVGQIAGTALGLGIAGPVRNITRGGEALGAAVAKALLKDAKSGFAGAAARGAQEAAANAALMAATAFGHHVSDAVIADKPFAAESIATETGVAALLGFGAGFAGSALGRLAKASRGAVEASGVAVKESRAALDAVNGLTREWDTALEQHAQRVGVLKALANDGHISGDLHIIRSAALRDAGRARDALRKLDPERALAGDGKAYQQWRAAVEKYQAAVSRLDDSMTPSMLERGATSRVRPGDPGAIPRQIHPLDVDDVMRGRGERTVMDEELDYGMQWGGDPGALRNSKRPWSTELKNKSGAELRAEYERIYGRPFKSSQPGRATNVDEANLGGQTSATSELGTNPGVRRRPTAPQDPANSDITKVDAVIGGDKARAIVDAFERRPVVARPKQDTVIDVEAGLPASAFDGAPPVSRAETGADFVGVSKAKLGGQPSAGALPPGSKPSADPVDKIVDQAGKRAVRDYLNSWFKTFDSKARTSSADQLQARLQEALNNIAKVGGSRLDSAGALALLKTLGVKEADSALGQRLDQVWSLGQAGRFASDTARGAKSPLHRSLHNMVKNHMATRAGRAIGGATLGGSVGGLAGALAGIALSSAGFAGSAAATAGKMMRQVAIAGEALLKGKRAVPGIQALSGNHPHQYSDTGPIEDPVERIQELQRIATNPEAIRTRVLRQLGDVQVTSPELADHLASTAVSQLQAIAASAPAIAMTPLGKPIRPSGTELKRFFQFENAMHNLPGVLKAIATGSITQEQIRALQVGFPAMHAELTRKVIGDVGLRNLETAKLRAIEKVLGIPLTSATVDPLITARLQNHWLLPTQAPQAPQAFKITAPKPTPVQAASTGRAPGNN